MKETLFITVLFFFLNSISAITQVKSEKEQKAIGYRILDIEKKEGFKVTEDNYRILNNIIIQAERIIKNKKINNKDEAINLLSNIQDIINQNNFTYTEENYLFYEALNKKSLDCDSYCFIYTTIAEKLNLPLFLIIIPQHMLILCEFEGGEIYWETTSQYGNAMQEEFVLEFYNIPDPTLNNGAYLKKIKCDSLDFLIYNNIGLDFAFKKKYKDALRYFNKSIELNENYAETYNHRGLIKYGLGDTIGAINDYDKALKIIPNFAAVNNGLAAIAEDQKNYRDAIEYYLLARNADERNKLIIENYEKFIQRIKVFKDLLISDLKYKIKEKTSSAELFYERGLFYEVFKDYSNAINDFSSAIKINPNYLKAYVHRGLCYNYIKNEDNALNDFNKAFSIDPNNYSANKSLLWLLFSQKKYNKAYKQAKITLDLAKKQGFDTYLSLYFHEKLEFLKDNKENTKKSKNPSIYFDSGKDKFLEEDYIGAIEDFDKAIEIKPDYSRAFFYKGLAHRSLGRDEEAIKCFDRAILIEPDYSASWMAKATSYLELRNYEEAIKCYDKVIEIKPDDSWSFWKKGKALQSLGRIDEANKCFEKSEQLENK